MSLLTIAQQVADEIGVGRPSALFGSNEPTARRLLAAANGAGQDLYRAHKWSILEREYEFSTSADVDNYAVPDDWGRPLSDTAWDRSTFWKMKGAVTPQRWQELRSGLGVNPALRRHFRLVVGPLAGSILIDPVPTATGDDLVIEYISRNWCESSGGVGQAAFLADTDECRIDHELFRLGLLWRMKRALELAYAADQFDYEQAFYRAKVADIALPKTCLAHPRDLPVARYPEGSWNA